MCWSRIMASSSAEGGQGPTRAAPRRGGSQRSVGGKAPFNKPIIIGVTGGMASGKSTLARMIAGRGIAHLDADKIVHHLLQHDRQVQTEIAAAIPAAKNAANGIDRAKLAAHISAHPEALRTLETILHPRVRGVEERAILLARANRLRALILDIPLLFETDAQHLCDVVIVAHAPLPHRRKRAFARPGMTEEKFRRLLDRQLPDHHRNRAADVVISTAIGKAVTRRKIQALMREWGL